MRRDGYVNATELCKAGGKAFKNWHQNNQTKVFVQALERGIGISATELIQVKQGGVNQGTWIHRKVAVNLAQWISPEFAVQVSNWVDKLEKENTELKETIREIESSRVVTSSEDMILCKLKVNDQIVTIPMRGDGYVNATELCKAGGKLFADWKRNLQTEAYLHALENNMGIPMLELVQSKKGGDTNSLNYGTWVHRKVAVNLAQWISPEFAVQVSNWVDELLVTGSVELGKEKTHDEIEEVFQRRVSINPLPYYDKDVVYVGGFKPKEEIVESSIRNDQQCYKFGISSNLNTRLSSHNRDFSDFRLTHVIIGRDRRHVSNIESRVKNIVRERGLLLRYGNHRELFVANDNEYSELMTDLENMSPEDDIQETSIELNLATIALKRKAMDITDKTLDITDKALDLLSSSKLNFDQMMQLLEVTKHLER